jgi:flagellin
MSVDGPSFNAAGMTALLLRIADQRAADAVRKLSSGLAVQTAGDGPAALAISEGLTAQVQALDVAIRNNADSANLVRTADGGLSQTQDLLNSMREAALGAANAQDPAVRAAYQAQIESAKEGLSNIADNTQFGNTNLLDGSFTDQQLAVGPNGEAVNLSIASAGPAALGTDVDPAGVAGIDVTSQEGAQQAIQVLDSALSQVSTQRSELGAVQANVLEPNMRSMGVERSNLMGSLSQIRDADMAGAMVDLVSANIMSHAGLAMLTQANSLQSAVLGILK